METQNLKLKKERPKNIKMILLLLLVAKLLADATVTNRNFVTMQNPKVLYSAKDYTLRIEMIPEATQFTTVLELETFNFDLDYSYISIGFGHGMLDSRFIVCHDNGDGSIGIHEHYSLKTYAPPVHDYSSDVLVLGISGSVRNKRIQQCVFSRPYASPNPQNPSLDPETAFKMVWAFNPRSELNYRNERFSYHGEKARGLVLTTISRNNFEASPNIPNFTGKAIHGFGMMSIWLILLPAGAFIARYFKSLEGWLLYKVAIQFSGVFGLVAFLIVIINAGSILFLTTHSIVGTLLLVSCAGQVIFGMISLFGMSVERLSSLRVYSRLLHRISGYSLLLSATSQIGLGINILYPWVEPRVFAVWILYIVLVTLWLMAFGLAEVYFLTSVVNTDQGYQRVSTMGLNASKLTRKMSFLKNENLTEFTWEELNNQVMSGAHLVVANGKYVYDISQWISSHPGGKIILHNVNGTDITNDYFHEAGFDAQEFTPKAPPPKRFDASVAPNGGLSRADIIAVRRKTIYNSEKHSETSQCHSQVQFTSEDWSAVQRSRRTHVHTRLAIQKLASLVVGVLVPKLNSRFSAVTIQQDDSDELRFDPDEYRRYAITRVDYESSPYATKPFVRMRFCTLYPYESRIGLPRKFVPGECIEIAVKLLSGEWISRYYSPVSGDMNAFEINFKIQPYGQMSNYLFASKKGERQIKVRGPFGTPILKSPNSQVDTIYFFAGGSGITPCLQLLSELYLPVGVPVLVAQAYAAQLTDEISLNPGDLIIPSHHYLDGWAYGLNKTTGSLGSYPVGCTYPAKALRLVLFNVSDLDEDIMGKPVVDAALLAYPHLVQVERFNSKTLLPESVKLHLESPVNALTVVCGPNEMTGSVVDLLQDIGFDSELRVLSCNSYN